MEKRSFRSCSMVIFSTVFLVTGCALTPSPVIFELSDKSIKISDHAFSEKEVSIAAATPMAEAECKKQGGIARYVSTYMPSDIFGVPDNYERHHLFACD